MQPAVNKHPTADHSDTAPSSSLKDSDPEAGSLEDTSSENNHSENNSSEDSRSNNEPKSPSHKPQHDNSNIACAQPEFCRMPRKLMLQVNTNVFDMNKNKRDRQ